MQCGPIPHPTRLAAPRRTASRAYTPLAYSPGRRSRARNLLVVRGRARRAGRAELGRGRLFLSALCICICIVIISVLVAACMRACGCCIYPSVRARARARAPVLFHTLLLARSLAPISSHLISSRRVQSHLIVSHLAASNLTRSHLAPPRPARLAHLLAPSASVCRPAS